MKRSASRKVQANWAATAGGSETAGAIGLASGMGWQTGLTGSPHARTRRYPGTRGLEALAVQPRIWACPRLILPGR